MFTRAIEKLKEHFGYSHFRPGQEEIIGRLLRKEDTLGIMPTGGGKSICYQIPAILSEGVTIVITPLISLMKDQVDSLTQVGIASTYLNSTLSSTEYQQRVQAILKEEYKLVYVAPERFEDSGFTTVLQALPISFVAVDEAHCVSEWGHDFRPSYRKIPFHLNKLKKKPVIVLLTATATPQVTNDIRTFFSIEQENTIITGFGRSNLTLSVEKGVDKRAFVERYIQANRQSTGIIYASTRKEVEQVYVRLLAKGYAVGKYHGGLSEQERSHFQDAFLHDNVTIMVATNAFGMGIDKSNVRYVIHYNLPKNMEAYYQEAGRAGRDGEESECILLFSPQDVQVQKFLMEQSLLDEARKANEYKKLQQMVDYCHTQGCLIQYILRYFGEDSAEACGKCSNCISEANIVDMTREAQMVFSCMIRMKQKFGKTVVAQVLTGSKNQKIKQFQFERLPTYGLLSHLSTKEVSQFIDFLIAEGFIKPTDSTYPTLLLTEKALAVLKQEAVVTKREVIRVEPTHENEDIFEALRSLRKEIATEEAVPPYVVFSDKTLREMSKWIPLTQEELILINGIGAQKLAKYGTRFLEVMEQFAERKSVTILKGTSETKRKKDEPSHLITLQLWNDGKTISEIAQAREMSTETAVGHLIKCKEEGNSLNLLELVHPSHVKQILDVVKEIGATKLKPIKERLGEGVPYYEIRIVILEKGVLV